LESGDFGKVKGNGMTGSFKIGDGIPPPPKAEKRLVPSRVRPVRQKPAKIASKEAKRVVYVSHKFLFGKFSTFLVHAASQSREYSSSVGLPQRLRLLRRV
jgi:hypothetical protein